MVSVLLVCPPGLEQTSLVTSINAIPQATVIAKAAEADSALRIIQIHHPDVLLADAHLIQDEITQLLKRSKELRPEMVRVVLTAVSSQKRRLQQDGADFVLDYNNLNRLLPQILKEIQVRNLDSISSE